DGACLAGGLNDSTILVWDVRKAARESKPTLRQLNAVELESCGVDLADDSAAKAHQAIGKLVASPKQSLSFLRPHARPIAIADPASIQQLIADLNSEKFAV